MAVLFCDTDCELLFSIASKLNITNIIRMPYTICGKQEYCDLGETYDAKKFFDLEKAGNMPITSGLNVEEYKSYFEPFFKQGEHILYVSFSDQMSGTFAYMDMAVKELTAQYPDAKFTRFDTKGISMGAGLSVMAAAKLFNEGKSVEEIVAFLDKFIYKVNAIFSPSDLMYLKRGGRLSAASAILGSMLSIKPIVRLSKEGKLVTSGKVNGRLKALMTLADDTIEHLDREANKEYPIVLLDADCRADAEKVADRIKKSIPDANIMYQSVSPVIGAHCGPDTLGICFVGDTRDR